MLICSLALAADTDDGVRVAVRGVGVSLADSEIGSLYRSSWFTGGGAVVVPAGDQVAVDVELSYKRMKGVTRESETLEVHGNEADLELIPFTVVGLYELPVSRGDLYAGFGWSFVSFRQYDVEGNEDVPSGQIAGMKICPEGRLGGRVDTGLLQAPLAPVGGPVADALEVEVYAARRVQISGWTREGFDLSAWRFAAGVAVRF